MESLGRVWGYGAVKEKLDGVLFVEKRGSETQDDGAAIRWHTKETPVLRGFQAEAFAQLGMDVPIGFVTEPIRVENLHVPGQGFGMGALSVGTPEFREFVQSSFGKDIEPEGPERIYLSRSAFGARRGGVIGETLIEDRLQKDGYEIFHPQTADLRTQLARYKAAKDIVALDGSALHLLAMVMRPDQNVAMIRRRTSPISRGIVDHLSSFSGKRPHVIDAIKQNWIRSDRSRVDRFSLAELDFPAVGKALEKAGMATSDGWNVQGDDERDALMAELNSETKLTFLPYSKGKKTPVVEAPSEEAEQGLPEGVAASCNGIQIPQSSELKAGWLARKINNGRYEQDKIAGALHLVSATDRVLECGAGLGIVGAAIAYNQRPEKMLTFEANPHLIPIVEATYKQNKIDNIISVTHGALMSGKKTPKVVDFNISKRFAFSSIEAPQKEVAETVSVPVHQFEKVKKNFKPTVLFMDIEGGELEFLKAADLSGLHSVLIEFHPAVYGQRAMTRCKTILTRAGFKPESSFSTETFWTARLVS